jgi:hypothetical protein
MSAIDKKNQPSDSELRNDEGLPRSEQPTLHDGEEPFSPHDCGLRGVVRMSPALEHSLFAHYLHEGLTEEAFKAFMRDRSPTPMLEDGLSCSKVLVRTDGYKPSPVVYGVGRSLRNSQRDPKAFAMKVRLDSGPYEEGTLVTPKEGSKLMTLPWFNGPRGPFEQAAFEDLCFHGSPLTPGMKEFIESNPGVRVGLGSGQFFVAVMPDGSVLSVDRDGTVVVEEEPVTRH